MAIVVNTGTLVAVDDLVDQVRRKLLGSHTGAALDVLSSSVDESANQIVLTDGYDIEQGTIIEIAVEPMYVRSYDANSKTATVLRGYGSAEPAEHTTGDIISIAPSFFASEITQAIVEEFEALNSRGLHNFQTVEFTVDATTTVVDSGLPATARPLFVDKAYVQRPGGTDWRPIEVVLIHDLDDTDYPSGVGFRVKDRVWPNDVVRVTVATNFVIPEFSGAVAYAVPDDVLPIVAVGATWRLLLGKAAQRLNPDWSHGSRRAEEIDPNAIPFLNRAYESQLNSLIEQALERQIREHPYRMDGA